MRVICDIEADHLVPDQTKNIWCIVCKDIDTEKVESFVDLEEFKRYAKDVSCWIGHNFVEYDYHVINYHCGNILRPGCVLDTLVLSRLLKFKPSDGEGQSLEAWGARFNLPKHPSPDFTKYSTEMLEYCKQDVEINYQLYVYLHQYLSDPCYERAIKTEMDFAWVCQDMHKNGFFYDKRKADELLYDLEGQLDRLDQDIKRYFPPRVRGVREYSPKLTKHGTISRTSVPRAWKDLGSVYPDCPFTLIEYEEFNPGSSSQVVERLTGLWNPRVPTATGKSWKVNEENLSTLKEDAPEGARKLVERALIAARIRTLTEWNKYCRTTLRLETSIEDVGRAIRDEQIKLGEIKRSSGIEDLRSDPTEYNRKTLIGWLKSKKVDVVSVIEKSDSLLITIIPQEKSEDSYVDVVTCVSDGLKSLRIKHNNISDRIHGRFSGIGTWPGRMSHARPNMGNVATKKSIKYKGKYLKDLATDLGGRMRSFWTCPDGSYLVGTDMEAAHVRLFAHYIDDPEFTKAVVSGNKKEGTDVHSLGAKTFEYLGCDRDNHKTFIFSFFNGAGPPKVAEIFGCSIREARKALELYQRRFPGIRELREKLIPAYARQGWFPGLDGRRVYWGEEHGMFAGMLQSGEAIVMKMANIEWRNELDKRGIEYRQVNLVHDEFVTECRGSRSDAELIGAIQSEALRCIGERLQLRCPLAGEYKVGKNWLEVH